MNKDVVRILPLSDDAISQIHSSIHITSIQDVIFGLLENALDARASKVGVNVDFPRGACFVEDNGHGIRTAEFEAQGGLGRMYYTSKRDSGIEFPRTSQDYHGSTGTFLARLSALSLLTVRSTNVIDNDEAILTIHNGKVIARDLVPWQGLAASGSLPISGTRVSVSDLFGNMPVRVRQRVIAVENQDTDKHWHEIKKNVAAMLLAWPWPCTVRIRDVNAETRAVTMFGRMQQHVSSDRLMKGLNRRNDRSARLDYSDVLPILFQAGLAPIETRESWIPLSADTGRVLLKGLICLEPAPTKDCQFIALGVDPCHVASGFQGLYDAVNAVFGASTFGNFDAEVNRTDLDERGPKTSSFRNKTVHQSLSRKGFDRHPRFNLQLNFRSTSERNRVSGATLPDATLNLLLDILEAAATVWLEKNGFRPSKRRKRNVEPTQRPPIPAVLQSGEPEHRSLALATQDRAPTDEASVESQRQLHAKQTTYNFGNRISGPAALPPPMDLSLRTNIRSSSRVPASGDMSNAEIEPVVFLPGRQHEHQDEAPAFVCGSQKNILSPTEPVHDHIGTVPHLPHAASLPAESANEGSSSQDFGDLDPEVFAFVQDIEQSSMIRSDIQTQTEAIHQWEDPLTRQVYKVNARTGTVIPEESRHLTSRSTSNIRPFSRLSSSGNSVSLTRRQLTENLHFLRGSSAHTDNASISLPDILKDWGNPVFSNQAGSATAITKLGLTDRFTDNLNRVANFDSLLARHFSRGTDMQESVMNISRTELEQVTVVGQVDRKFILCRVRTVSPNPATISSSGLADCRVKNSLILIDQHAASERIILEQLLASLCAIAPESGKSDPVQSAPSLMPVTNMQDLVAESTVMTYAINAEEHQHFERYAEHFQRWGISYSCSRLPIEPSVPTRHDSHIMRHSLHVLTLPTVIAQRCAQFPDLAISMLRQEVWALHDGAKRPLRDRSQSGSTDKQTTQPAWIHLIAACPQGLLDMLNSRACRSAIMFNDELSLEECERLVQGLRECVFPFVCAHGRVSMVPLVDLGILETAAEDFSGEGKTEGKGLAEELGRWMRERKAS